MAEHGGIVVRTKELTELAKELRNKGKRLVMFLGDSITEGWRYPENGNRIRGDWKSGIGILYRWVQKISGSPRKK